MFQELEKLIQGKMRAGGTIDKIPYDREKINQYFKNHKTIQEAVKRLADK